MIDITDEVLKKAQEAYLRPAIECAPSINRLRWALEAANEAHKEQLARNTAEARERLDDFHN